MPVSLSDFVVSETGYVAKLNANNEAVRSWVVQNETSQANLAASATSNAAMMNVMFGGAPAVFADTAYRAQAIGADLIVSAGVAWAPSQQLLTQLVSGATVSMSGQPAGTYYLNAVNGTPLTQPVISTTARDPLYSFLWNGTSITELTRLALVLRPMARGPAVLPFATSLVLDFSRSDTLRVTLTGDATITGIVGGYDGQRCALEVTQDATGGRTLAPGPVRVGSDVAWSVGATALRRTRIDLIQVGGQYDLVAVARGF